MVVAGDLAREDSSGAGRNESEDGIRYQLVVDDDIGTLQDTQRLQGQQIRIARTGTDEMHGVNGLSQRWRSLVRRRRHSFASPMRSRRPPQAWRSAGRRGGTWILRAPRQYLRR